MKKQLAAIVMIFCMLFLPACQVRLIGNTGTGGDATEKTKKTENQSTEDKTDTTEAPPADGSVVRTDGEGLVKITIKDGRAQIEYDLDKWADVYDMGEYLDWYDYMFESDDDMAALKGGPFPIQTQQDNIPISDVCIGKINTGSYAAFGGFLTPTVIFLMGDGTLEYSQANLATDYSYKTHYSYYPLHWIGDIASLSYENDKDGEKTIYATAKSGARYDTKIATSLQSLVNGVWRWAAPMLEDSPDGLEYYGYFLFENESEVIFEIGLKERQASAGYRGSYRVVLAEGNETGYLTGSIIFDLALDWNTETRKAFKNLPKELHCSYFPDVSPYGEMRLWRNDGDYLFALEGSYKEDYMFELLVWEYEDYPPDDPDGKDGDKFEIVWTVEPTLKYDCIYYCPICGVFGPKDHEGDILDPKTGKVTRDKKIIKDGWNGHGIGNVDWFYDEAKKRYGAYFTGDIEEDFEMYTRAKFLEEYPRAAEYLLAFRKVDSSKVKKEVTEWGTSYDFTNAYIGDKYAFAYGLEFVTDFVYDYDTYRENDPGHQAAAQLGDKWGVIGRYGEVVLPFVFEHILFIDDSTVFAKYEGKYGIITVAYG